MPVTSVTSDADTLSLTAIGDYPVPVERLWQAWTDPRQLERFWGPPTWPATFTEHDVRPGGRSAYRMNGPNGEVSRGWWQFEAVEAPTHFRVTDGFANDDGTPNDELPVATMDFRFESTSAGSRFTCVTTYASLEAMESVLNMGMIEGLTGALSQLDDVLADLREHSRDLAAALTVLDDTHVEVVRVVRGSLTQVWRAHHEPALLQQWMLGPDGWTMPTCEVATEVGQTYRYEWVDADGENRFGFTGELLESEPPRRSVTTESMIGMPGPGTHNELVLEPVPGNRTRIRLTITYPSVELRDMVLGTGMVDGMEASYARLETVLAD